MASTSRPRSCDVVAVGGEPGPAWRDIVAACWDVGAAFLPIDHRLAPPEVAALLARARPTLMLQDGDWTRPSDGVEASPGTAAIVASSGTTGEPQLVELGRPAVEAAVAGSLAALGAGPADAWLCCLPPAHIGGLLVILRSVLAGAPLTVHGGFDLADVADAVNSGSFTFTSLVPTMVARLLRCGAELERLRGVLIGGAGVGPALRSRIGESVPGGVLTYGQTQTCGGVVYDGVPLPGVEVRIGEGGEVQVSGATRMTGHRLNPQVTAAALTPDGWVRTGDAGRFTATGLLEVHGRLDDVIVTGGEKVWPGEVEAVVRELSGVAEVAVAGRPDPEWGMRVVAYVVPSDPASPPTRDQLRKLVAGRLARYKAPSELVIVHALPTTVLGKVRRSALPGQMR